MKEVIQKNSQKLSLYLPINSKIKNIWKKFLAQTDRINVSSIAVSKRVRVNIDTVPDKIDSIKVFVSIFLHTNVNLR